MAVSPADPAAIERIARRGVSDIIVREEFLRRLQSGESLRLKMGFDPSRPDIHLGHRIPPCSNRWLASRPPRARSSKSPPPAPK